MARKGITKRLGARYGSTTRLRLEKIESLQKKKHQCPKCSADRVKRVALGIWKCTKCGNKFAGGAYKPKQAKKGGKSGGV